MKINKLFAILVTITVILFAIILITSLFFNKKEKDISEIDPNLIYSSKTFFGLCSNEEGESVACYTEYYLYKNGLLTRKMGWLKTETEREDAPVIDITLNQENLDSLIKKIKDTGLLEGKCSEQKIMDASWNYIINIDGVLKTFHNPENGCQAKFGEIDKEIKNLLVD